MRVVLHAGFHKTGTTSLQSALIAHAPRLLPGICVQTRANSPTLADASEAARVYSLLRDAESKRLLREAVRVWLRGIELLPGQDLLVSSEDFAGHMPGRQHVTDYHAAVTIAVVLARTLARVFPGGDVQFLYTVRDPDPWLASLHWQLAINPQMLLDATSYADRFANAVQVSPLLDDIRRATGMPVHAVALETLQTRRLGPVEAMYDLAQIDDTLRASLPPVPARNQRTDPTLADVFVALNREDHPKPVLQAAKAALMGKPKNPISPASRKR